MVGTEAILIALCYGVGGQLCRTFVGLKKMYDAETPPRWSWMRFAVSLGLGATAALAATSFSLEPAALWAAGYAGADALEGFARKAGS